MTKEQYDIFTSKTDSYFKKAKLLSALFILVFAILLIGMFIHQVINLFIAFIIVLIIMTLLYKFVFKEYIFYTINYTQYKRISIHKQFEVTDEVLELFNENSFQNLYDIDFVLVSKNDVYVLATKPIDNSLYNIGLAVYFNNKETEAVNATPKVLSNELSGFILKSSLIKVVLLVSDEFSVDEKDYLKYNSAIHKNTVVIGLEKNTNILYYNYFLNGIELDDFLSELFKVDLTLTSNLEYEEE